VDPEEEEKKRIRKEQEEKRRAEMKQAMTKMKTDTPSADKENTNPESIFIIEVSVY
jgi:hypothetical protein